MPKVIQELERQNRSRAFDGFPLLEKEESSGVKLLHTLRWNQMQNDPERVIEVSSCVVSLAFHPNNPAVFAAGTFNGELLTLDLSHSEDVSPIAMGECSGSITSLSWISHGDSKTSKMPNTIGGSTSNGYIFIWGLNLTKQMLPLKAGFMLQSQDIPRGIRTHIGDAAGIEVTTASFNHEDSTLFVIGAEGGGLFVCSTASEVPAGKEFEDIRVMRCVTSVLNPHTGRVLTSQFSPHHRNAILSSASDNQIRLYSLLQRPMVVATGLVTGQVSLHDFGSKSCQPFLMLPAAEKPSSITTLKFNRKEMGFLGVGDQLGRVSIWQLPDHAVSPLSTELTSLFSLLDTVTE